MNDLLKLPYGLVGSLFKKCKKHDSIGYRYVRNDGGIYWITLVDFETGQEYNCVKPMSLYLQLNYPYSDKEARGFEHIQKDKGLASMAGRTFYQKGFYPKRFVRGIKNIGPKLEVILTEQKLKYKIGSSLRGRVTKRIKEGGGKKSANTENLIGCSVEFFMGWLEKQFIDGMTWDNYGEWHIDHIKPCNTFNMLDVEEQKKCFHYTNCRPLWAYDNLRRPKDGSDAPLGAFLT